MQGHLCVPKNPELKKETLQEAYNSRFSNHLSSTKMYHDLNEVFFM